MTLRAASESLVRAHDPQELHQLPIAHQFERRVENIKYPRNLAIEGVIERKSPSVMTKHNGMGIGAPTTLIAGISRLLERTLQWHKLLPHSLGLKQLIVSLDTHYEVERPTLIQKG